MHILPERRVRNMRKKLSVLLIALIILLQAFTPAVFAASKNEVQSQTAYLCPFDPTSEGVGKSDNVIQVTKDGVALPPVRTVPSELVENPFRSGSYGKINSETGKFQEVLRIDPATPKGQRGPSYSHYHLDGGPGHYSPRPGNQDPWLWR
jgi:hypothetical protein